MAIEVSVKELDTGKIEMVSVRNYSDTQKVINAAIRKIYGNRYTIRVNYQSSGIGYATVALCKRESVYKNLYICM